MVDRLVIPKIQNTPGLATDIVVREVNQRYDLIARNTNSELEKLDAKLEFLESIASIQREIWIYRNNRVHDIFESLGTTTILEIVLTAPGGNLVTCECLIDGVPVVTSPANPFVTDDSLNLLSGVSSNVMTPGQFFQILPTAGANNDQLSCLVLIDVGSLG